MKDAEERKILEVIVVGDDVSIKINGGTEELVGVATAVLGSLITTGNIGIHQCIGALKDKTEELKKDQND